MKSTRKAYDAQIRGYSLDLMDAAHSKMEYAFPKSPQQYGESSWNTIIIQAYLPREADFSFTVNLSVGSPASRGNRRVRILFSTSFGQMRVDPLHIQVPLKNLPRELWFSLDCDLASLVTEQILGIESLIVSSCIRLRRLVLMKDQTPFDLPQYMGFPANVVFSNVTVNKENCLHARLSEISMTPTVQRAPKPQCRATPRSVRAADAPQLISVSGEASVLVEQKDSLSPHFSDEKLANTELFSSNSNAHSTAPSPRVLNQSCLPDSVCDLVDHDVPCSEVTSRGMEPDLRLKDDIDLHYQKIRLALGFGIR